MQAMTQVMTEKDKQWNLQYAKLLDFKRQNEHCIVPNKYKEDTSLGTWVCRQRNYHTNNNLRKDRKELLDEIGFVWKAGKGYQSGRSSTTYDQIWNSQYKKLVEFKEKNGHCIVPRRHEEDLSLGRWVFTQRCCHNKNKTRADRKDLLDELGFVWQPNTHASCTSATNDVRGLFIVSLYALVRSLSSLSFFYMRLIYLAFGFGIVDEQRVSPKGSNRRNRTNTRPREKPMRMASSHQQNASKDRLATKYTCIMLFYHE